MRGAIILIYVAGAERVTDTDEWLLFPQRFHSLPVNQMRCARNGARGAGSRSRRTLKSRFYPTVRRSLRSARPSVPITVAGDAAGLVVVNELVSCSWHADRRHLLNVDLCRRTGPDWEGAGRCSGCAGGQQAKDGEEWLVVRASGSSSPNQGMKISRFVRDPHVLLWDRDNQTERPVDYDM